jgi:hypothetical protein
MGGLIQRSQTHRALAGFQISWPSGTAEAVDQGADLGTVRPGPWRAANMAIPTTTAPRRLTAGTAAELVSSAMPVAAGA